MLELYMFLLNVEIALTVHTSEYGNFCDREVFANFGKLKLVPKKEEKKPKNNRLKKNQQILLCSLNCIVFWEFFHFFFPAEITSTSTLLTVELKIECQGHVIVCNSKSAKKIL